MSLKKQIDDKLNQALKAKDKNTYPTLRLIVSAIKDAEIAGRSKGQKELSWRFCFYFICCAKSCL